MTGVAMSQVSARTNGRVVDRTAIDTTFFVAIDHRFIDDELDGVAQEVYDALGALDAAAPAAIAPLRREDLVALVEAGERAACGERAESAARRVRHVLERS
jgi:hypothetical protein